MNLQDLDTANALKKQIDHLTALQNKMATSGAKVSMAVVAYTQTLAHDKEIKEALGDAEHDAIIATALTAINTSIASVKTTKEQAFAALLD